MDSADARSVLARARAIQEVVRNATRPHSEVTAPSDQPVLPHSLFTGTRGYIEKVVYQINRSYTTTCYDACAVMMRRLLEILIIETFEGNGIDSKVKNATGDYLRFGEIVDALLAESQWTLDKRARNALPKMKDLGDHSAHGRRFNAKRHYIDEHIIGLRTIAEELLYLSHLKK
jgi:hypothetical protein